MKTLTQFFCQSCGQSFPKWQGRCTECGTWNSLVEERVTKAQKKAGTAGVLERLAKEPNAPRPVVEISPEDFPRLKSGIGELDNVLGGGLVPGSVILLGGEPGIGKSTMLLQVSEAYARLGHSVLYVTGEESTSQVALRSERVGVESDKLLVLSATDLETIQKFTDEVKPKILVVDSVQTTYSGQLESAPGSVGQLRECTFRLVNMAKANNMATFLVGHVTKEGTIAGPKLLEHMVDAVLYFETTPSQSLRLLRSMKNRFGSTHEIGLFEMTGKGMMEVTNPSALFLAERPERAPGSAIVATLEGSRSILIEIQALVSQSALPMPRRTTIGLDPNRVALLIAILEKRGGYRLFDQDIFVNVAGGIRVQETACDLGVAAALISSFRGIAVDEKTLFLGELGLGGEIRSVPRVADRLKEAARIGFTRAVLPQRTTKELENPPLELLPLENIQELADKL